MADYDYTRPTADDAEEDAYEIRAFVAPTKTADDIEAENTFREIPVGDHVLEISAVQIGDIAPFAVTINGKQSSYLSRSCNVTLSIPGDKRAQVRDYFVLPPDNPNEADAYNNGTAPGQKNPGFASGKFYHFADRLGLLMPGSRGMNPSLARPSRWVGRAIQVTIAAGRGSYTNKKGEEVPRGNQVKMFSYRSAAAAAMGAAGVPAGSTSAHQAGAPFSPGPHGLAGSAAPQNRMAAVGLGADDL